MICLHKLVITANYQNADISIIIIIICFLSTTEEASWGNANHVVKTYYKKTLREEIENNENKSRLLNYWV